MKVHTDLLSVPRFKHPIITIGTFDGVHLGHGKILQQLVEKARAKNGESVVFTFFPHPRMVLFPHDTQLKLLTGQKEKIKLIESYGIDHLVVFPFTREFSRLTAVEFVRDILVNQLQMKELVIGYDHHFGRNREGSIKHLTEMGPIYGFEVEEIPARHIDEITISSTKIRKAILEGDMETAQQFLGYPFELTGMVVHGNKRGASIGFPTANLNLIEPFKIVPGNGVYITQCEHKEKKYNGIMNIGHRPTVEKTDAIHMEVHLLDASVDLYGELLRVKFLKRLRNEQKFVSLEALKIQIANDEKNARTYINQLQPA